MVSGSQNALQPAGLSKIKLKSIGCVKLLIKDPSITSYFK